jgi:hypothetical protein
LSSSPRSQTQSVSHVWYGLLFRPHVERGLRGYCFEEVPSQYELRKLLGRRGKRGNQIRRKKEQQNRIRKTDISVSDQERKTFDVPRTNGVLRTFYIITIIIEIGIFIILVSYNMRQFTKSR